MTYLVLDTDFLIRITNDPVRRLDLKQLATEFTIATIPSVLRELQGLSRHGENKTARRASNALRVIEEKGSEIAIQILPEGVSREEEVDLTLVDLAKKGGVTVATMDHSLLSKLERMRLPYLTLRADNPLMRTFSREQRI